MRRAVLDTTVLVSAFLNKTGISYELLRHAAAGAFVPCFAEEILDEVNKVLRYPRIRKKLRYEDDEINAYVALLRSVGHLAAPLPRLRAVIRDPNDDMIIACAVKAQAQHIVSRDKDLLELGHHDDIRIVSPEAYITLLRQTSG